MADHAVVLTKSESLKQHVLGLKDVSRAGTASKLSIADILVGERLIPEDPRIVAQLAASIEQTRQLTPILVHQTSDGRYALIDGLNRIAALKQLGETEVMATVLSVASKLEAQAFEAISNTHRRQRLTALARALTDFVTVRYVALKVPQAAAPRGGRQPKEKYYAKAARELGVSPDQIARSCKIAKILPYVQNAIRRHKLDDNQSVLLEIAASGDDVHSQVHTLGRVLNRFREPEEEPRAGDLSKPDQFGDEQKTSSKSQSGPSNEGRPSAFENTGTNGRPSGGSVDNMSTGDVEAFARLAAQSGGQSVQAAETNGKTQGGPDQPEAKDRDDERAATDVGQQIHLSISPDLGAKLASFADSTAIRVIGFFRAPAGAQPRIEVQDVTKLNSSNGAAERA